MLLWAIWQDSKTKLVPEMYNDDNSDLENKSICSAFHSVRAMCADCVEAPRHVVNDV